MKQRGKGDDDDGNGSAPDPWDKGDWWAHPLIAPLVYPVPIDRPVRRSNATSTGTTDSRRCIGAIGSMGMTPGWYDRSAIGSMGIIAPHSRIGGSGVDFYDLFNFGE